MAETPELVERIGRFLREPAAESFEDLALEAFAFQWRRIAPYRRLCEARGVAPGEVSSWREVPATPTAAFKTLRLAAAPAQEIFRSSGTTAGPRAIHYHPFPNLYRQVIDTSFPTFCLPEGDTRPLLSLIPSRHQVTDSSLGFMADHLLTNFGTTGNENAFDPKGVAIAEAQRWCDTRRREGKPGLILATAFALVQWLEALAAAGTPIRLPEGSVIFETGGFKGRSREIKRKELLTQIERWLGVAPRQVVREYGMTELTSQLYSRSLLGGDPDLLVAPHWVQVRILDPASLEEAAPGKVGLISIFDLANLGSAAHLLTEDLGVIEKDGLRLLGRASGAELRGCSLTVEELSHGLGG